MAWTKDDTQAARSLLLEHFREHGKGWFAFNSTKYASSIGLGRSTIQGYMKHLRDSNLIEVESSRGRNGGYKVRVLDGEAKDNEHRVKVQIAKPIRVCRYCKTEAANEKARFCWKCGNTLLTEKELLHEEWTMCLAKIARNITDSAVCNSVMETLTKVEKFAFKEE